MGDGAEKPSEKRAIEDDSSGSPLPVRGFTACSVPAPKSASYTQNKCMAIVVFYKAPGSKPTGLCGVGSLTLTKHEQKALLTRQNGSVRPSTTGVPYPNAFLEDGPETLPIFQSRRSRIRHATLRR